MMLEEQPGEGVLHDLHDLRDLHVRLLPLYLLLLCSLLLVLHPRGGFGYETGDGFEGGLGNDPES